MSRHRTLLLCGLTVLIDGYDVQAMGLSVPTLARATGLAPTAYAPAIVSGLAGMALGATLLAPLGDRFGKKPALVGLLLLIAVATFAVTISPMPLYVAAARFIAGLGLGALLPVALAMAAMAANPTRLTLTLTLVAVCAAIGSFIAGIFAPMLEAWQGWRGLFYVGAIVPLLLALLVAMLFPPSPEEAHRSTIPSYAGATARLFSPALRRRTAIIWTIFFISLFGTYSLISWLPTLLALAGWAPAEAQRATGFLALGAVMGGLGLAWLADRGHGVLALATSYLVAAGAFAALWAAPETRLAWIMLIILVGASAIGCQFALGSLVASIYPREIHATALGWSGGLGRAGSIVGPIILSTLIAAKMSSGAIIGLLLFPMLLCGALILALPRALRA